MPFREKLRYALRVLDRILSVFVAWPASYVALILAFISNFSFSEFAYGAARYFREVERSSSVNAWASEAASQASQLYWTLVLTGLAVNIIVMGPRNFFMMHPPRPGPAGDGSQEP